MTDRMLLDGGRAIDLRARTLDGETFTTREAELLAWLAERPHQVVTWEALHEHVWRFAPSVVSRAPYFTWRRLVKKVEPDPEHPRNLVSHHGDGVAYVPPAASTERAVVVWGPPGSGRDTVAAQLAAASPDAPAPLVASTPTGAVGERAIWVGPLGDAEARALLRTLGVEAADAELDTIGAAADGLRGRLARAAQAWPALGTVGVVRLLLTERLPDAEARVAALAPPLRAALALVVALGGPVTPGVFVRAAASAELGDDVLQELTALGLLRTVDGDRVTAWHAVAAVSPVGPDTVARVEAFWAAEPYEASAAPPEHGALRSGLERLVATLESPAARARAGLHLVRVLFDAGKLQPALVLAERLVPGAEPPHDRYLLAQCVRVLGTLGLHDELEEACAPLLARCAASDDQRLTARTTANLARVRQTRGDSAGALPLLEQARAACRAVGDVEGEMRSCLTMGTVLSALGRWPEAERAVRSALVRAVDRPARQREARGQLALQHVMRGDLEAAEAGFGALAEPPDSFATHNYFLVRALLGHPVEALAGLARLATHARTHATEGDVLHHLSLAAMIALAVNDDEAARLALEAEQVRQALGDRTPLPRAVRGVVTARRGDHAQARRLAAPEPSGLGGRFDVPLLCLRAEVALAGGEPDAARALVAEARDLAARQHTDPRSLYVGWAALAAASTP